MDEPRPGQLEILDETECVKLLRSHDLGRIAVVDQNVRPLIFPVNYFFDESVVAFRTAPGAKLQLAPGTHVSFEIDGWNANKGIGWSVLVKGIARHHPPTWSAVWTDTLLAGPTRGAWIARALDWHPGQRNHRAQVSL